MMPYSLVARSSASRCRLLALSFAWRRFASQEFHLVLVNTDDAGRSWPVGDVLRIGKATDNELALEHPTVSRNHLVIRRQGDQFLVQDLGSTNGTFIDGAQVREGFLRPGALLEVGDVQLQVALRDVRRPPRVHRAQAWA